MSSRELIKRYAVFIAGLFFTALGVGFAKHAGLGVSPISSVANVLSCKFTFLTLGNWLIVWNCILILGQILVIRRDFQLVQLLQIPLSVLFGWFTDLGMKLVVMIPVGAYASRLALLMIGIVILGIGISLSVIANVILNSGEAFVKAVADTFGFEFSRVKTGFDLSCVIIGLVLSLLFFDFAIVGIREGTVITAMCTGTVVRVVTKRLKEPLNSMLK